MTATIVLSFLTISGVISAPLRSGLPAVLTQVPVDPSDGESGLLGRPPAGSRVARLDLLDASVVPTNLTPTFSAAAHPDLSFDAERILFIGKKSPGDATTVWELTLGDGSTRALPLEGVGAGDCLAAIYLSTLYSMDMEAPADRIGVLVAPRNGGGAVLYSCQVDGTQCRRISFAPDGVSSPYLLSDGRLLVSIPTESIEDIQVHGGLRDTALLTIHVDGTDLFPFAGLHEPGAFRHSPCETRTGQVVYVESGPAADGPGGSLVTVERTRSLRTRQVIADDADGSYLSPSAMPGGGWLVSFRSRSHASYGLYALDVDTGGGRVPLFDDPAWHEIDAVVIRPRPSPAGRSSVVNSKLDMGRLYCLDIGLSDGEDRQRFQREDIKRVRIFGRGSGSSNVDGRGAATDVVLGEVPVEIDGSFFLEVPAGKPLRLETLDASGKVLQSMKSWLWVMPGERRGCIGCHEDRELTPTNRHVLALRKAPRKISAASPERSVSPR